MTNLWVKGWCKRWTQAANLIPKKNYIPWAGEFNVEGVGIPHEIVLPLLLGMLKIHTSNNYAETFFETFRMAFPRFAEKNSRGAFMQQDADEFLMQLLSAVQRDRVGGREFLNCIFQGEYAVE